MTTTTTTTTTHFKMTYNALMGTLNPPHPLTPAKFCENRSISFCVILLTNKQTNKQTPMKTSPQSCHVVIKETTEKKKLNLHLDRLCEICTFEP